MSYYIYKHLDLEGKVVYVGQTKDMDSRQGKHSHSEYVDKILFIEVETREIMDLYEKFYISKYNPKYNIKSKSCNYTKYLIDLEHEFIEYKKQYKEPKSYDYLYPEVFPIIRTILKSSELSKPSLTLEDDDKLHITVRTLSKNIKGYISRNDDGSLKITRLRLLYRILRIINYGSLHQFKVDLDYKPHYNHIKEIKYDFGFGIPIKLYHYKDNIFYVGKLRIVATDKEKEQLL